MSILRKLIVPALVCLALSVGANAQEIRTLPQVADGAGVSTTFIFFNNTSSDAVVTMTLTNDDGDDLEIDLPDLGGVDSSFFFQLPSGESRFFKSRGTADDLSVGAARVVSTVPIGVSASFSLPGTEAGIPEGKPFRDFDLAVDSTSGFNTGLAILNLAAGDNQVTFRLFNEAGQAQGGPAMRTLPGSGHLALFFSGPGGIFPDAVNFRGRMEVRASSDVSALTLRQGQGLLTTLPVVPIDSDQTEFNLPQIAAGADAIRTSFVLFALGNQGAGVDIDLTDDNGQPLQLTLQGGESGSSFNVDVPANGAVFLETASDGPLAVGAARVTSNVPIGVTAIFSLLDGAGGITTETGIGDSPAFSQFTIPVDLTGGFDTGVALFNTSGSTPAAVQFQFIDDSGIARRKFNVDSTALPARGHLATFVSQLFVGLGSVQGQLSITSNVPLAALTLRQGNGVLTSFPVAQGVTQGGPSGPGSERALPEVRQGVNIVADSTLNETLENGFIISGTVSGPIFPFVTSVMARGAGGELFLGQFNLLGGTYRIVVPSGTYELQFCYALIDDIGFPFSISLRGDGGDNTSFAFARLEVPGVQVAGDTTRDVNLPEPPLRTVTGAITNLGTLPPALSDDNPIVLFSSQDGGGGFAAVNGTGAYMANLTDGNYTISIGLTESDQIDDPAILEDSGLFIFDVGQVSVNGDQSAVNIMVPQLASFSGTVTSASQPILPEGAGILANDGSVPLSEIGTACFAVPSGSAGDLPPNGVYSLPVASGREYDLIAVTPIISIGQPEEGLLIAPPIGTNLITPIGNTVANIAIPAPSAQVTLSGRVTGAGGEGLGNVSVSVTTTSLTGVSGATFTSSTTTDGQGNYSLTVLSGVDYTVSFVPLPPIQVPVVPSQD